jgi:hypothetical protein
MRSLWLRLVALARLSVGAVCAAAGRSALVLVMRATNTQLSNWRPEA